MELIIKKEEEKDFKKVEQLTREAFWNLYVPGCDEHYLVYKLRKSETFLPELDFIALKNDEIVGNIMFSRSYVVDEKGKQHETITFGPLSVLPKYHNQGIGKALVYHAKNKALDLGYKAIVIYGYPEYYNKLGFKSAKEFNITNSEGKYPAAHLVLELYDGALKNISGKFFQSDIFMLDEREVIEFDNTFDYKEKFVTDSQNKFAETNKLYL